MSQLDRRRQLLVLVTCCTSVLVVVTDISIVNVALPSIRRDLHASIPGLQWTVDAYTLVLASLLVLAGSTADRIGRRRTFRIGLAAFGIGSLLCGLAPSTGWLIAARALQAVGGAMLNPVAMAITANTFPDPTERARAIGIFDAISGLSLALGPIAGGALVDSLGWRSVFWINVPIVMAAIVCVSLFVPESRAAQPRRADPVGQALVMLMLGSIVFAIIESRWLGWTSPIIPALLAATALGALAIVRYESRRTEPLLELRLFRSVPFSAAILMALSALCGFGAFLFVTTQYLQDVRGLSPIAAGLCVLPIGVPVLLLSPITGRAVGTRGPTLPLLIAGAALTLGAIASMPLAPTTPLPTVLTTYLLFGTFLATVNPPITNTALSGMPHTMSGTAASLVSTARQTGTTLGVAISGSIGGSALTSSGTSFTTAVRGIWPILLILGLIISALGALSTSRWATHAAERAGVVFEKTDRTAITRQPRTSTGDDSRALRTRLRSKST